MDNLAFRMTSMVKGLIESAGVEVRSLPPYSSELKSIEQLSSKLKGLLRSVAARTVDAVIETMSDALRSIRPGHFLGWFGHSGWPILNSTVTDKGKSLSCDPAWLIRS